MLKIMIATMALLIQVAAFADSPPTVTCKFQLGYDDSTIQSKSLTLVNQIYIDSRAPSQQLVFGPRTILLGTNESKFYLTVVDGNQKTGNPAFFGEYTAFDGDKDKGGFTGNLTFVSWKPRQDIRGSCFRAP